MVDLDGTKDGVPKNAEIFTEVAKSVNIPVELGGGIRTMETVDYYIANGISRVILGSIILQNKDFAEKAIKKYGEKIAAGIDSHNRKVKTWGWLVESEVDFVELAVEMAKNGVKNIISTNIAVDGMLSGVQTEYYKELKNALPSDVKITASGGVKDMEDIIELHNLGIYGVICGKSIYSGTLDLKQAVGFTKIFNKNELIPAVIQDYKNSEVLMLGYMNKESFKLTLETKRVWFYSRSRQKLWNKGETSGNFSNVKEIYYDCEDNSLLIKVEQTGVICHTGNKTCYYRRIL